MKYLFTLSLCLFFLGILLLFYFYSTQKPIKLKDLGKYIGETVLVEGDVISRSLTKKGNLKLKITDNTSEAWLIIYPKLNGNCSHVMAIGKVSEFMGNFYIFVYREKDILLCKND
jgi:hypothetical protein